MHSNHIIITTTNKYNLKRKSYEKVFLARNSPFKVVLGKLDNAYCLKSDLFGIITAFLSE